MNAMSELALKLIAENKAKHARGEDASYLDLGRCGLTELPDLSGMDWLETLVLSGAWEEFDTKKNNGVGFLAKTVVNETYSKTPRPSHYTCRS